MVFHRPNINVTTALLNKSQIIFFSIHIHLLENVKYFKYLGSMLTEDGSCTCEIKSRIAKAKAAFNRKKNPFNSKLNLNLRKKLVKCYVCSMAVYGSETWTLRPHFTPGKSRYPFYRRMGRPQGRSGWAEILVPTGIRSRTVK